MVLSATNWSKIWKDWKRESLWVCNFCLMCLQCNSGFLDTLLTIILCMCILVMIVVCLRSFKCCCCICASACWYLSSQVSKSRGYIVATLHPFILLCKLVCVVSCLSSQLWPTSKSCPQLVIFSNFIFLAFHFQQKCEQSKTCTSRGFSRSPKSSCSPFHLSLALRPLHWWCHCWWCFGFLMSLLLIWLFCWWWCSCWPWSRQGCCWRRWYSPCNNPSQIDNLNLCSQVNLT